jgi:hypothetical protein
MRSIFRLTADNWTFKSPPIYHGASFRFFSILFYPGKLCKKIGACIAQSQEIDENMHFFLEILL